MTEREKLIEAMARGIAIRRGRVAAGPGEVKEATAALAAIEAMGAVVVPVEATDRMFFDPDDVCTNMGQSPWAAFCEIYAAMLAASPYAKEPS
jgi:hypothetical protein